MASSTLRLAMLAGVLLIPALVGVATIGLTRGDERDGEDASKRSTAILGRILRGYPLTAVMAPLLGFLAGLAVTRKIRHRSRGWIEEHVPFVVKPGGYDTVARDLAGALRTSGLEVEPRPAPASMSVPARVLAKIAGPEAEQLVPPRLLQLVGPDFTVLLYPSDLMIVGRPERVRRARAALASRLTTTAARMTAAVEAQELEDRIGALGARARGGAGLSPDARAELRAIDAELARRDLSFDDWQVVYRERLQAERDLRAVSMDGRLVPADGPLAAPGPGRRPAPIPAPEAVVDAARVAAPLR
jgi:hypothetical protein